MGDLAASPCYSLEELVHLCGGELRGDGSVVITGAAPIAHARGGEISFCTDVRYLTFLDHTEASALVVPPSLADRVPSSLPLVISSYPRATFAKIASLFCEERSHVPPGIHHSAWIGKDVVLGVDVSIGPMVCIEEGAVIGEETSIMAQCYVGRNVRIGQRCRIFPGVIILEGCTLGSRVVVHSGTVIGSDGFGYAQDEHGEHVKIPQRGTVIIEDDVEIGANCTIDRATFGETRIERGTKIDNLVTVAHNVTIGQRCILAGQVGIAGSSVVGEQVIMGGQVGVADHVVIGKGVKVGPKSGIAHDVPPGEEIIGVPAIAKGDYIKLYMNIRRIERMKRDIEVLRGEVRKLSKLFTDE